MINGIELFLLRYNVLYDFWLFVVWEDVPEDLMRQRPHPRVNSLAWNMWHLTRVEDIAINRFIADRPQVLDEGDWMEKMGVPLRHNGFAMTFPQVDELSQGIDLGALRGYSQALKARTLEVVSELTEGILQEKLTEERVRAVMFDEGAAGPGAEGLVENYIGWTKAACLMNHALTHSYHHVGEMNVISSLLGLES
ncbi:MAG: DinB family protein [Anaerolineales bacterium]|jgi:uncharacterized damage-inducible protein DinB